MRLFRQEIVSVHLTHIQITDIHRHIDITFYTHNNIGLVPYSQNIYNGARYYPNGTIMNLNQLNLNQTQECIITDQTYQLELDNIPKCVIKTNLNGHPNLPGLLLSMAATATKTSDPDNQIPTDNENDYQPKTKRYKRNEYHPLTGNVINFFYALLQSLSAHGSCTKDLLGSNFSSSVPST